MALLWADGFDHYGSSDVFWRSGQYVVSSDNPDGPLRIGSDPAYIRTGGSYWDASQQIYKNWYGGRIVGGTATILGAGAAFYFTKPPTYDTYCPFMFVAAARDDCQISIRLHPDGSLTVHQGRDGAQLGFPTKPGVIVWGSYSYIEACVICDDVNGRVIVRVNNQVVNDVQNTNTDTTGQGILAGVVIGTRGGTSDGLNAICNAISDFVIWDDTGPINNGFLGDVRCRTLFPVSDGAQQDWVAHGDADASAAIARRLSDNDGSHYISGQNVGDTSTFNMGQLPTNTGAVFGLVMMPSISKSDAGICTVTPGLVRGAGSKDGSVIAPGTGSAIYPQVFQTDPNGGGPLSVAAVNTIQARLVRSA